MKDENIIEKSSNCFMKTLEIYDQVKNVVT